MSTNFTIANNLFFNDNNNNDNILIQLEEIKKLSIDFEKLFLNNTSNNLLTSIIFNYNFKKEYANGFIEYKRTLSSYKNSKIDKLIKQIYWRIYEGLVTENIKLCYYIIGLEDSGLPSNLSKEELEKSINIILNTIPNTELNCSYLYLHNSIQNYNFIVVKIWLDNDNQKIEYF